ncbi:Uncharacterised protein [Mycobacteroides abscessus subsp. abscessus]|uniref:hypothetical protein n=1 Tax=Mycobacteroides abscessus TaxID=36809 RepID=UPI0009A65453|nr:hypothetical protein [Mycobacteroides abscessus]SKD92143.1 Uncharacterised protein [Mycobacteroides abscessus subsp. abscessus]
MPPRKGATPAEISLATSIASNTRWAKEPDRLAAMGPAHKAFRDKFEREVDPDGVLTAAERAKRAENARKAHFARLAYKSAVARRERKARRAGGAS